MTLAPPEQSQEAARALEYERWLGGSSLSATVLRWLMGPQGQLLANGPLLRMPAELKLDSSVRLLDIGCGRGSLMRTLDEQLRCERAPVGLDYARAALRLAQQDEARARRASERGYVQASATALPFDAASFNLVTCGYVAKHLDDDELSAMLHEVHRVLDPGGLALVWEFGPTGNQTLDAWNARTVASGVGRPRLRSTGTLIGHAEAAGFAFARAANLRPFLVPPIPRASVLIGRPPKGWEPSTAPPRA